MTRIFISLAWLALVMVAATLILGLSLGDFHRDHNADTLRWATVHRLAGVAAALAVLLVNSIVVTYFIGTSRWCKEVSEAYDLDLSFIRRSTALKRRTFPWAVIGMLTAVAVVASGGAADPATGRAGTEDWVTVHLVGACCGLLVIAWAFFAQWQNIRANYQVIADVLDQVKRLRTERGLEV